MEEDGLFYCCAKCITGMDKVQVSFRNGFTATFELNAIPFICYAIATNSHVYVLFIF